MDIPGTGPVRRPLDHNYTCALAAIASIWVLEHFLAAGPASWRFLLILLPTALSVHDPSPCGFQLAASALSTPVLFPWWSYLSVASLCAFSLSVVGK